MAEKLKSRQRERFGKTPGGLFAGDPVEEDGSGGTVMVSHGPYMEHLPVGNMTIRDIRSRFCDRLDIDPLSRAVLDGHETDENTVVQVGQLLTFVRKAGEKGHPGKTARGPNGCDGS